MAPNDPLHTAIHEAGHAVAAYYVGQEFDRVSLTARYGMAGSIVEGDDGCEIYPDASPAENEAHFKAWAMDQATIDYAGQAALVQVLGIGDMTSLSAAANGAGSDYARAFRRLSHSHQKVAKAKARAIEIVTERVDAVRAIADLLVVRQELWADALSIIIDYGVAEFLESEQTLARAINITRASP